MPRNPVVNRRNVHPLKPRSVPMSEDAAQILRERAAELFVSQGSLVDTLVREMARTPDQMLLDLMRTHGLLADDEYGLALELIAKKKKKKKDKPTEPDSGA